MIIPHKQSNNSHYRNSRSFGLANRWPHLGRNRSRYSHCQTLDQSSGPQDLLYLLYLTKKNNEMIKIRTIASTSRELFELFNIIYPRQYIENKFYILYIIIDFDLCKHMVSLLFSIININSEVVITGMTAAYGLEQSSSIGLRSLVGFLIRRRKILRRGQWRRRRNLQSNNTLLSTLITFWPEKLRGQRQVSLL